MKLKRLISIIFIISIILSLSACKKSELDGDANALNESIGIISESMNLDTIGAMGVLEVLCDLGLDSKIEYIYSATDGDGKIFYKVWYGLNLMKVYITDGEVSAVYKNQELLYPDLPQSDVNNNGSNKNPNENGNTNNNVENNGTEDGNGSNLEIEIVELTSTVEAGKSATIKILGSPSTEYEIEVKYSSGASQAKGLEPKISDENGYVSWTWKVSAAVKPGEYSITVSSNSSSYTTSFTVE